jgi:hypothetical protein
MLQYICAYIYTEYVDIAKVFRYVQLPDLAKTGTDYFFTSPSLRRMKFNHPLNYNRLHPSQQIRTN